MKNIWRLVLILIALGLVTAIVGFSLGANTNGLFWDKTGLHLIENEEMRIQEMDLDSFTSIEADVSFCDIEFVTSTKYGIDIIGYKGDWDWSIKEGKLSIIYSSEKFTAYLFDFKSKEGYVKVYLPAETVLDELIIKSDSGDVDIGNFNANKALLSVSFGKANIYNITGGNIEIEMGSGQFTANNLDFQTINYNNDFGNGHFTYVTGKILNVKADSGNLELTNCSIGDLIVKNSFGKITASSLYSSSTNIEADSGDINLIGELSGKTFINSKFGDVTLKTTKSKDAYSYDIFARFGKIILDKTTYKGEPRLISGNSAENSLEIIADSGNVNISFGI